MPLMPKRTKFRKQQRGNMGGNATSCNTIAFGEYGLQSLGRAWITNIQLEACRISINRAMKRKGKVWIRVFPDKPISKKPLEVRMGKGKGATEEWVAVVKPGCMLFELDGVPESIAREALRLASNKLPIRTRFITRHAH
ncbi:MAG: 50S ribosomal protein L16 [Kiritimatiellae bacterium]|nr:50S ribosomal protein L16 [Kiritimatiellia bacterium]MDD4736301.1 50S ribosomal protein L16 [Kiritimatiellia bacterium]